MGIIEKVKSARGALGTRFSDIKEDFYDSNPWGKIALTLVAVYLVVGSFFGIYWSFEPDQFSVHEVALKEVDQNPKRLVTGAYTTSALIHAMEGILDKPGGYITNDLLYPGIWLDNIPNWEFGVLKQARDLTKAMREEFSRSQSQSIENKYLARAESQFNFDNNSWLLPQSEGEYREGIENLRLYLESVSDENTSSTQFFARADNLRYWLKTVETRLGSLSQRLSASVGTKRLNTDLAGEPEASQATKSPDELLVKTPWTEIDDVFYEARGSTWALIHFLKAVEIDFAGVLEKKNAKVSVQQIIRELEATQETLYSPVILNGDGFGMLANHSLVMASYISRANAAIIDLRELLAQG